MQIAGLGQGDFDAEVYTFELLGDSTLVNLQLAGKIVSLKADKHLRLSPGERIGVRWPRERLYWFDAQTGARVRG
jgi:multiple sugar transport system ATP-binding protein